MKIKKFNELFDNPDLKAKYEIPYLKGELKGSISGWKSATADRLADKIAYHCPFLIKMKYTQSNNLTSFGFSHDIKFGVNDFAFIYFSIQIREIGNDKFLCHIFARATRKGRELYSRTHESKEVNFDELVKIIDEDGYNILTEFNNWTLDNFDYKGSEHLGPEDKPKNYRKN